MRGGKIVSPTPLVRKKWSERWEAIDAAIIKPRDGQRKDLKRHGQLHRWYDFEAEPFSVTRKQFYPIAKTAWILNELSPQGKNKFSLFHESDGLIFQNKDEGYCRGTDLKCFKWKYARLNSVDFVLRREGGKYRLYIQGNGGLEPVQSQSVSFDAECHPSEALCLNTCVECVIDAPPEEVKLLPDRQCLPWRVIRGRGSKEPNHIRTYHKIMDSIFHGFVDSEVITLAEAAGRGDDLSASGLFAQKALTSGDAKMMAHYDSHSSEKTMEQARPAATPQPWPAPVLHA